MKNALLLLFALSSLTGYSQNALKKFFRPISKDATLKLYQEDEWEWRPIVSIPALKITDSSRDGAKLDAMLLTSVGGGITWQKGKNVKKFDNQGQEIERWRSSFSWSPATILLAGNFTNENSTLDISYAQTIGFFDNLLMLGGGYNFGYVEEGRSRFFLLLSIGINFNN